MKVRSLLVAVCLLEPALTAFSQTDRGTITGTFLTRQALYFRVQPLKQRMSVPAPYTRPEAQRPAISHLHNCRLVSMTYPRCCPASKSLCGRASSFKLPRWCVL